MVVRHLDGRWSQDYITWYDGKRKLRTFRWKRNRHGIGKTDTTKFSCKLRRALSCHVLSCHVGARTYMPVVVDNCGVELAAASRVSHSVSHDTPYIPAEYIHPCRRP